MNWKFVGKICCKSNAAWKSVCVNSIISRRPGQESTFLHLFFFFIFLANKWTFGSNNRMKTRRQAKIWHLNIIKSKWIFKTLQQYLPFIFGLYLVCCFFALFCVLLYSVFLEWKTTISMTWCVNWSKIAMYIRNTLNMDRLKLHEQNGKEKKLFNFCSVQFLFSTFFVDIFCFSYVRHPF